MSGFPHFGQYLAMNINWGEPFGAPLVGFCPLGVYISVSPNVNGSFMDIEDEDSLSANSEMRYISLELMKLAQKSGRSFREVASEYMKNTALLQDMIIGEEEAPVQQKKKGTSTRENK